MSREEGNGPIPSHKLWLLMASSSFGGSRQCFVPCSPSTTLTPKQLHCDWSSCHLGQISKFRISLETPTSGPSLAAPPGDAIFSNSLYSYDNDLGHNVSSNITIKIANDQYLVFNWLLVNFVTPTITLSIFLSRTVTSRSLLRPKLYLLQIYKFEQIPFFAAI